MSDYEMTPTDATTDEQDLAVWLCQSAGYDPAGGYWKTYVHQARLFLAFRKWEAKQD